MAERTEIAAEIEALTTHCRPPLMEVDARMLWLRDWCTDLGEFPIEAIRQACRKWRHSGATKFPTAGQLMPLVRANLPDDGPKGRVEPWRPLSDAEYATLTVREKIRHHTILAHEAGCKAGPMWRNPDGASMSKPRPGHVTHDQMPPAWRQWKAIQSNHLAEATRLRGVIHNAAAGREA
jgi:hypothetical protein